MPVTDRMLIGSIAANPGRFDGAGVYRYCRTCDTIYFTAAQKPDGSHDAHVFVDLPALNPDGSGRMVRAYQAFVTRAWPAARQTQIAEFARKAGWELAMELKYGGGVLEDEEAALWQAVLNRELERLAASFRRAHGLD